MSRRDLDSFLRDVVKAGEAILRYVQGKTFDDYLSEDLIRSAVERQFTIIGEAVSQALKIRPDLRLEGVRDIVAFRNILVHGYQGVDHPEVWRIIHDDLPLLLAEAHGLLSSNE
jgi:uncharacterized protein with HEPN domain